MATNRLEWVETLKCIGIVVVILGHISSPLSSFIYSWHMPFFFIIAGFFLKVELSPILFFKKEFYRLMIPYFIFSLLAIFIESIKRLVLNRDVLNWNDVLQGTLIWMDINTLSETYAFVLWFLPALLFARFSVYLVIKYILSIWVRWIVLLLLFFISMYTELPFAMDEGFNAALFVYIGWLVFKADNNFLLFGFIIIGLYLFFGIPSLDMASKSYQNPLLNIIWSVGFSYLIIAGVRALDINSRLILIWGGNTMLLFIIHPYTNNIATLIVDKYISGFWFIKLLISLILLQCVILFKSRYGNWRLFRYV